jgi:hypothetical protein
MPTSMIPNPLEGGPNGEGDSRGTDPEADPKADPEVGLKAEAV